MNRIGIVGLGKLGLPLALAFASRGFKVVGVDINPEVIESIKTTRRFFYEPGVTELLLDNGVRRRFSVTDDLEAAVLLADVTIVIVATPNCGDGCFSLKYVFPVIRDIGDLLREKDDYHLVIISSTVNPGDCERHLLPELFEHSGKKVGLCYVPEFVALGNVLNGFLEPDRVLIGVSDTGAASMASAIYGRLCRNNPPIKQMNLVNAELAKIAANCHTVLKTVFANQMAELCEAIPGADVDEVTEGIALDSRASPEYLKGSTMAAGPCFLRDLKSLSCIAERYGIQLPLIETTETVNYWQVERLARMVQDCWVRMKDPKKIGILGLTYKPGVNVYEPSAGLMLLEKLTPVTNVIAYDPAIQVGQSVRMAEMLIELADIVVLTTPWKVFEKLEFRSGQVVIDCWRCLNQEAIEKAGAEYVAIGRG